MEQPVSKAKPWMLPFWLMVGITVFYFSESLLLYRTVYKMQLYPSRWYMISTMLLWPSILLVEATIYWFIRKRIENRRWVWAHLLFSLFAFVLLLILYFIVLLIVFEFNHDKDAYSGYLQTIQKIKFYTYWSSIVAGHIFFIIAVVRGFSHKSAITPPDPADFLSELD
jgi:hypothetical protein